MTAVEREENINIPNAFPGQSSSEDIVVIRMQSSGGSNKHPINAHVEHDTLNYQKNVKKQEIWTTLNVKSLDTYINKQDEVCKESLYKLHKNQILNGDKNDDNIISIVHILGGIDNILNDYLNENNNLRINKDQLIQIKQILCATKPNIKENNNAATDRRNIKENNNTFCTLDTNDTFLYSLCGAKTGKIISNILHNKLVIAIIILSAAFIWCVYYDYMHSLISVFLQLISLSIIVGVILIPYLILNIFSSNKKAFDLIIRSFEFWFKLIYSLLDGVILCIRFYNYCWEYLVMVILIHLFIMPLGTIWVSLFDALNVKNIFSMVIPAIFALSYSWSTISYQFLMNHSDDYMIYLFYNDSISFNSLKANLSCVLAIFFWKQVILSFVWYKNSKAVSIKYTPYLKWTNMNERKINHKRGTVELQ